MLCYALILHDGVVITKLFIMAIINEKKLVSVFYFASIYLRYMLTELHM